MTIKPTSKNIEQLTLLTRLLGSWSDDIYKVINNQMPMADALSGLKYLKLDSPRNGIALNERTTNFAKAYLGKMLDGKMRTPYETMENQFWNKDGSSKKHRTLNIFDETGDINGVFDSKKLSKAILKRQFEKDYKGLSKEEESARMVKNTYHYLK